MENVQHYCKSINSDIIYTDEIVHSICNCLCNNMPYTEISKIVFGKDLALRLKVLSTFFIQLQLNDTLICVMFYNTRPI